MVFAGVAIAMSFPGLAVVRPGAEAEPFPLGCFCGTEVLAMTQETSVPKKRRGPPATGWGTPIQVRLQPELLTILEAWRLAQPDPKPSRPEAIRRLLTAALDPKG
jgi:hypothetical protein